MSLIHIDKNPPAIVMRWMGLLMAVGFGIAGAVAGYGFGAWQVSPWLWAVGVALALVYYAIPPLRRPLYLSWMYAAAPVGWVLTHASMALVFFGVLAPVGLVMRLFGHDPLRRRFDAGQASYWVDHQSTSDLDRYFRQY